MLEYLGLLHDENISFKATKWLTVVGAVGAILCEAGGDAFSWLVQVSSGNDLFYFLVAVMDTLYVIFVILDLDLDFGLVRVLCWNFLRIFWLPQNRYIFHTMLHFFQGFLDSCFWNIPKYLTEWNESFHFNF